MAEVPSSIAISPSGTTLLNAMQVTTTAGSVLNEVVTLGDAFSGNVGSVLASGAQLVEPGGANAQPVTGTFFPPVQTVTGTVAITSGSTQTITAVQPTAANFNATVVGTVTAVQLTAASLNVTAALAAAQSITAIQATAGNLNATVIGTVTTNGISTTAAALSLTATVGVQIIPTGGAGNFQNITDILFTNPMTTAATVTLNDGTTSFPINLAPSGGVAKTWQPNSWRQGGANASWTAALGSAGTVSCLVWYVGNK
jgi:hypothetical protein